MLHRLFALLIVIPSLAAAEVEQGPANAGYAPAFAGQTRVAALPASPVAVSHFARGLAQPWGIARLPSGQFLVTEKRGTMQLLDAQGQVLGAIGGLPAVQDRGQGGLLDVAVSPGFATDRMVYWTYAKAVQGGVATAAARGVLGTDGQLQQVRDIFVGTAARGGRHFGSRIIPRADGSLWITTGDRGQRDRVQDGSTTLGNVIHLTWNGDTPVARVWSRGHRNIQGAAVAADGALWTIEHGPAGGDELNQPRQGRNYGWPIITYGENYSGSAIGGGRTQAPGLEQPVYYWDPVIAPAGMAFYRGTYAAWQGDLLIGSLNPGGLVRLKLQGGRVVGEERLLRDAGRIRDVAVLPDGAVLLLQDNGDILRLVPGG